MTNLQEQPAPIIEDESNIELNEDDAAHFDSVIELLANINFYIKAPYGGHPGPPTYDPNGPRKGGDIADFGYPYWKIKFASYNIDKPYMRRLIYYYGRHINPILYDSVQLKGMHTPYGYKAYMQLGYRGIINLVQEKSYKSVRDMVVAAIEHYKQHQPGREPINTLLNTSLSELKGRDFISLLNEWEAQKEFKKSLSDLY